MKVSSGGRVACTADTAYIVYFHFFVLFLRLFDTH